jgi:two-component system, chemotaxis family, protein-glutamate methylesterase/glutaminase
LLRFDVYKLPALENTRTDPVFLKPQEDFCSLLPARNGIRHSACGNPVMEQPQPVEPNYIVVAGASAGGLHSVQELAAQLNAEMHAAVFVCLHFRKLSHNSVVVERLQAHTDFTCKLAEHGEPIRKGYLYLAPPDRHLVIRQGAIVLGQGPQENLWRPSIDVLFRSAAAAYDGRVIGIIMSGLMYDGTAGMSAIKRCGGTSVVQDPAEAEYKDMIQSVLKNVQVDYCVPLEAIGGILTEKTRNGFNRFEIPNDIRVEAEIAERMALGMERVSALGERSPFICPDCGGGLWEMVNDEVVRYRCHTGHVYNEGELLIRQSDALENTLWTALRMMEERRQLLEKMSREETQKGWKLSADSKHERARALDEHINRLKGILFETKLD